MAIVTASEWKDYRGYPDTRFDSALAAVIPMVQAEMERYCSRKFDLADYEGHIDGTGTPVIYTRHWPIVAVSEVRIDPGSGGTPQALDPSAYEVDTSEESTGRIVRTGSGGNALYGDPGGISFSRGPVNAWPTGYRNVQIDYTAGYTSATVPADLKEAALILIDHRLAQRGGASIDQASTAQGASNVTYRTAAERMAAYEALIGRFRRAVVL